MDLQKILNDLKDCPCGKEHTFKTQTVQIGSGITAKAGEILVEAKFPKNVLVVGDNNTMTAALGILESLDKSGFNVKKLIYSNMKYAKIEQVLEVEALCGDVDGIISVGTGSLNDICRAASYRMKKEFCIFATAPSMDGFASDTAPIIENNFKISWKVEQPLVIIADTKILAKSPVELKAAGFGDMVAKYIGILDWRIANLLIDEYYCPAVAEITMRALRKTISLADKVTEENEEAAGAIMEALVLSGLGMKLAESSRPASGAEHVVSHYWECYKLARGIWPEYHGRKVGVATVLVNKIYRNLADRITEVNPINDPTDWDAVYAAFSPEQQDEVHKLNSPTITDKVSTEKLKKVWPQIREFIYEILPTNEELLKIMKAAGAVTEPEDVHIDDSLLEMGLRYHSYMRYRILLTRILPMLGLDIMDFID